ncbi:MAG: DUF3638 domain-containing protein [Verrucomicrobia bacterium]|nr:DUF3638 domain-containing protein [Verrucomicrobiota bacterium]
MIPAKNVFDKKDDKVCGHIQVRLKDGELHVEPTGVAYAKAAKISDIYDQSLQETSYRELYNYLYHVDDIPEVKIPYAATEGVQAAFAQNRPSLKQQVQEAETYVEKATTIVAGLWSKAKETGSKIVGGVSHLVRNATVEMHEELRELCQLHCSKDLQIDSTISYFQENPRRLFDRDGRLLFHALLFESDLLAKQCANEATRELTVERLRSLFDAVYTNARKEDPKTCADVLWLAANVQRYLKVDTLVDQKFLTTLVEDLVKSQNKQAWPEVFEALLAASGQLFTGNLPQEDKLFVYGLLLRAMRKDHAIDADVTPNLLRIKHADMAEEALKMRLATVSEADLLKMVNEHAPAFLKEMYPILATAQFSPVANKAAVFETKDKKTTLSLTDGMFISTDPEIYRDHKDPVPQEVMNLMVEQKLYGSVADMQLLRCNRAGSVYTITDPNRDMSFKVDLKKRDVFVMTKDLPWSHHIVKDEERAKFTNRELASCFQWYDAKAQKTFLVDPKSLKPLYELQQDGTVVATGSASTLAQTPAKSIFSGFEDPASSIYWTDKSGSLQSIDFPRIGIGFTRNQKNEFCVKGAEKWLLSDNQSVPGFMNSSGLLVVENSDTKERKLLMPVWDIQAGGAFDFSVAQERTHYLECPIIHGELKPKSTEVRYYLAKLYLARGNVEAAETLLYAREAHVTSKKLDPQLTEFLRDIANMPLAGASSRVLKLQMQALYLLQKNDEQFPKEALKEEPIKAKDPLAREVILQEMELALAYLSRVPDEKRLSAAKELFVLDKVMLDYENAKYAEDKDPQLDKLIIDIREAVEQIRSLEHKTEVTNRHEFTEALAALEPLSKLNTLVEDRGLMRHIRRDYFEKLQKPAVEPVSKTLFSANAVELAADDEAGKSKFKSLMDDIEIAEKSTGGVSYTITGNQEELFSKLEAEEAKERKLLAHVETLIVNNVIQTLSKDPEVAKAFQTRERFYPTIEELAFLVSRRDYHDFAKKHYPQLLAGDREALQEAIKKYFFQKETWQQLKRAVNRVEELKAATPELAPTIMDNLGSELDRTRAYPPDHPYAMIFLFIETTANIKLRPEQVQNILKLAEAIREDKNLVFQMIMGAGKTAVIQPLLAILLADSNSLSTVMVPEAQFAKVRSKLAETLGNVAEKMLVTFPYDIELSQDTAYVDQVLARLKTAKEDGAVVLLASRQKHSILTSMYEAYYSLSRLPERIKNKKNEILNADDPAIERKLNEELKVLEDDKTKKALEAHVNSISALCDFLQLEESAQIDEIDMIMNPKVIFKRPIGERVIFDKDTGFQRSRLLTDLLLDLATNEKLNNEVSIDFANAMRSPPGTFVKQPASYEINEQLYYEKVQPFLVQRALVRLKNNPQLKDLIEKHGDVIGRFLTQEATEDERKWVGSHVTDKMAQELLGAAAHAITNVLKTSLLRECKSNYGKDPMLDLADPNLRKYIARPYAAPGKPKPTVYADPHEKIIYSVQYYLYNGIPEQDAKDMLIEWQQLAKKEMRGRSFEDTKWAARLEELRLKVPSSDDFFADPKSKEFKALLEWFQKAISKDPQSIMDFCQKRLFNQNAIHAESVTSTPQTLAGSSKKVFGYTGTLHQAILATFMDVVPEPGTDGKTIAAMEAKFRANAASVDTMARDANLVNEAINQFKDPDYNVFIDSGNWLKDVEITKFAADVLEQCGRKEIEGVVFHDSDGNEVCLERDELGKTKIVLFEQSRLKESPEKRLTVILSRFETGTDIPQRPTAKAFMSIRKGMTLRDALQSAFRMRGILSGQSVTIKVSDEVKSDIAQNLWEGIENHPEANKELSQAVRNALAGDKDDFIAMLKPDSETVWRYLAANLIHEEQDKNWAAARYKMRETFEVSARAALTSKAPLQDRMELFNKISSLLVQHENPSRFRALVDGQKDKTADEAIADAMQPFLKIAANVRAMPNISADLRSAFEEKNLKAALEACVDKTQLAKVISGRGVDAGAEMEAEAEAEVEQEQEQEQVAEMQQEQQQEAEVQVENVPPPAEPNYQPIAKEHPSTANGYSIDDIFDKQFAHFNNALPQGLVGLPGADAIEYTDNFIIKRAGKGDLTSKVDLTSAEYAANRLAARYMLVLKENNKTRYVILSHEDAVRVKRGMLAGPVKNGRVAMLTDLNGKVVSQSQRGSMQEFDAEQLAEKRLLAKFLTVKPIISSRDVDRFKAIVERAPESHKLLDECRKYYEKAVSYLPTTCEEYNGSYLGRVLNNI